MVVRACTLLDCPILIPSITINHRHGVEGAQYPASVTMVLTFDSLKGDHTTGQAKAVQHLPLRLCRQIAAGAEVGDAARLVMDPDCRRWANLGIRICCLCRRLHGRLNKLGRILICFRNPRIH